MKREKIKNKINDKIDKIDKNNTNHIIKKKKKRKKKIIINVRRRIKKKEVINNDMKERSTKKNALNKEISKYKGNNMKSINKFVFFEKEYNLNEIENCQISEFLLKAEDK
ncbi:conserved Plasmodium protein, unknown function [Plasmodium gallinaceum]|uniref:Uncharacterized protein n=1 Tax=Plasmodium gallinaceum TaxID=5849 RepID=A0A1J1GZX3_PLAGA|nr:conserved Plasmodium protein, unknown function [Plasmodium gallinaceum]CRG98033.1 conserved Plasmodium protein, unknown function [Plasmodium gallinaceum]